MQLEVATSPNIPLVNYMFTEPCRTRKVLVDEEDEGNMVSPCHGVENGEKNRL